MTTPTDQQPYVTVPCPVEESCTAQLTIRFVLSVEPVGEDAQHVEMTPTGMTPESLEHLKQAHGIET